MLITQQLLSTANKNLARPTFRYLGKETSYSDFRAQVARLSYLYQHELGFSPRVALFTRNAPAVMTSFFAIANIRGLCIPVNPEASLEEIISWLKDSRATHLAVTSDLTAKARDILSNAHLSLPIIEIEKKHGGEYDTSYTTAPEHQPTDKDTILLLRTSGTTEKPRFAAFTHLQINHAVSCLKGCYHLNLTDRYYTPMNWYHPFAFIHGMLFPLMNGATTVIDYGLEGAELIQFLIESRVNRIIATPQWLFKLLITCKNEQKTLPGIKSVTVGGGPLDPAAAKVFGLMKITVAHCYGMTENLWTISMQDTQPAEDEEFPEMHKSLAGLKYKVIDKNGDEIPGPDSRTGQLCLTGPCVMSRYDGADKELEKKTKSVIRGTWLYTGDIARLEGDGETLRIEPLGRAQDLIEIDGEFVSMSGITATLKKLPGVDDAAAFVTETSKKERVIVCAIVKANASTTNEKTVLDFCTSKLYADHIPKAVAFTDSIPKDLAGNPSYGRLRIQFSGIAG